MLSHVVYTVSVYLHVLAACAWIGSMFFFAAVVVPVLRRAENGPHAPMLLRKMGRRFRIFGWVCLALLLVTGALNLALHGIDLATLGVAAFWTSSFGRPLSYKLLAVVVVFALTAAHDALSTRPDARKLASWLGRATLLASMVVVLFAVWLVRGMP